MAGFDEKLLYCVRVINQHTHWLDPLKASLGLTRLAENVVLAKSRGMTREELECSANRHYVTDKLASLSAAGIDDPDVYVFLVENMGDIIAAEPISRLIKKLSPKCRLHWIVRSVFKEVVQFNPYIDDVIEVKDFEAGSELCDKKELEHGAVVVKCHLDGKGLPISHKIFRNPANPQLNEFNYLALDGLLSYYTISAGLPKIDESPIFHLASTVSCPINLPSKYMVIHCRASEQSRDWGDDNWNELVERLTSNGWDIVEIGIQKVCTIKSNHYFDLTGRKSIQVLAGVIANSVAFIGVDSGFAHIANAFKRPSVLIFGAYRGARDYHPYSGDFARSNAFVKVKPAKNQLAASVPVEDILRTLYGLMTA